MIEGFAEIHIGPIAEPFDVARADGGDFVAVGIGNGELNGEDGTVGPAHGANAIGIHKSLFDQAVYPAFDVRNFEVVILSAADGFNKFQAVASAAVIVGFQNERAALGQKIGGIGPAFGPLIVVRARRAAVRGGDERIGFSAFVIIRIKKNSFDVVIIRAFPVEDFRLRDGLVLEIRIQIGNLKGARYFHAIKTRAKKLGGRAGGRIFINQSFAVVAQSKTEEVFYVFGGERFSGPGLAVADETHGFGVHAVHEQGDKTVAGGLERTGEAAIPVEIYFGRFAGGEIVEINSFDRCGEKFWIV